ncbi:MAG: hypothetical protein IJW13_06240 [Clostridia bacterium]|nr:hypothetical protein [Clostridia bacterium]
MCCNFIRCLCQNGRRNNYSPFVDQSAFNTVAPFTAANNGFVTANNFANANTFTTANQLNGNYFAPFNGCNNRCCTQRQVCFFAYINQLGN